MDFEFDKRLERAETLPSRVYTDASFLDLEKRAIFNRTWQLVGRTDQLPEPGSYFTADVTGEPVLIARDGEGRLRGYFNVCRHRAGPVAKGAGCRNSFQCGYHGWSYSLDGRLIGVPDFDGVESFHKEQMRLTPVRVETWEQFVFVNLDLQAPPLADFLEDIPALTRHINISNMSFVERRDYLIACNWKVYVDNYLEGYHIPIVHPGLMRELDYSKYRTVTRRYCSLQDAPIRKANDKGGARRYEASGDLPDAMYFWVFPNLMININPETLSTNLILPVGHDKTLTIFEWFAHGSERGEAKARIDDTVVFRDEIQQEDIDICEAVQRGLKSVSYDRGRYSVKRENGVHHFHSLWGEFISNS